MYSSKNKPGRFIAEVATVTMTINGRKTRERKAEPEPPFTTQLIAKASLTPPYGA